MNEKQKQRFSGALRRLAGDGEMLTTLATIATEDAPGMLVQLKQQLVEGNLAGCAKTAHALKGLLSTFETDEPVTAIQVLIDAARNDDAVAAKACHEGLQPEIELLVSEIAGIAV